MSFHRTSNCYAVLLYSVLRCITKHSHHLYSVIVIQCMRVSFDSLAALLYASICTCVCLWNRFVFYLVEQHRNRQRAHDHGNAAARNQKADLKLKMSNFVIYYLNPVSVSDFGVIVYFCVCMPVCVWVYFIMYVVVKVSIMCACAMSTAYTHLYMKSYPRQGGLMLRFFMLLQLLLYIFLSVSYLNGLGYICIPIECTANKYSYMYLLIQRATQINSTCSEVV